MRSADDLTTRARIRNAAIACIGEVGLAATTAREVASRAGVSPGSIINHFGSMDGLRAACDEHVIGVIRANETEAIRNALEIDYLALWGEEEMSDVLRYVAAVLSDDSPTVATFVDELVRDAERYLVEGEAAGVIAPTEDPRARAVLLTLSSLGYLALHSHLRRLLDGDLQSCILRLVEPSKALYRHGIVRDPRHDQGVPS